MLAKLTKVSASHGGPALTSGVHRKQTAPQAHALESLIDSNPIHQYFEIGPEVASAGPELAWKIYSAKRKADHMVSLILICFHCKIKQHALEKQ